MMSFGRIFGNAVMPTQGRKVTVRQREEFFGEGAALKFY